MEQPLVVTDPSDNAPALIREAGELAAALGVPLRVLTVVTQEEFDNDADVFTAIATSERAEYSLERSEYAEKIAETAIRDLLLDADVEAHPIGRGVDDADDRADEILDVASEEGCDYIFMTGRRRSPTGKAVFGDTAQRVILNFDGYVVTLTE